MSLSSHAFVTLVTRSDAYGIGALVLAYSLKETGTQHSLVVMVTDKVTSFMQDKLRTVFDQVVKVDPILSNSLPNLELLGRPDLYATFTKIQLWTLTTFTKVVFLDADTLVLHNIDDLFQKPDFSASPDIGWPDCFNSGVFVTCPSLNTYNGLLEKAKSQGSFDGGDQGLFNDYFSNWNRLSFLYNVTPSATYSYSPAYKRYQKDIKVLHFIGAVKPWQWQRTTKGHVIAHGNLYEALDSVERWWQIYDRHMHQPYEQFFSQPHQQVGGQSQFVPQQSGQQEQSGIGEEKKPIPFFKSRYEWDEQELGLASSQKTKLKSPQDLEEERKLPLKKPQAQQPPQQQTSAQKKK